jgi:hypothetical protein
MGMETEGNRSSSETAGIGGGAVNGGDGQRVDALSTEDEELDRSSSGVSLCDIGLGLATVGVMYVILLVNAWTVYEGRRPCFLDIAAVSPI